MRAGGVSAVAVPCVMAQGTPPTKTCEAGEKPVPPSVSTVPGAPTVGTLLASTGVCATS